MVDYVKVTEAVQNVFRTRFHSDDLSKKPSDFLPGPVGVDQFTQVIQECGKQIKILCNLNLAWPEFLPAQNGQPFAQVYFSKSLAELISYLYNYVTAPPAADV